MSPPPLVSVVLIFRDDEAFLGEAVASVLDQTLTDWELLLVDDGSTDGSTAIARTAAASRPERIRYLDHPGHVNRGISATRNRGIREARGRYVALLDSDDVWLRDKLQVQVGILESTPEAGLLVGASEYWWSWAGAGSRRDRVRQVGAAGDRVHHPPTLLLQLHPLGEGTAPCPSSAVVRREVLERLGGFEDDMPGLFDDQGFFAKAWLTTPAWVSTRCLDRYRRHPGAVTLQSSRAEQVHARAQFLTWLESHLHRTGVTDPAIHTALQRAWWPHRHPVLAELRRRGGAGRSRLRRRVRRWAT